MTQTTAAPPKASDRQVEFIKSLIDERNLFASPRHFDAVNAMDSEEYDAYLERLKGQAERLNKRVASAWISQLLDLPKKDDAESKPQASTNGRGPLETDVPAGRYAITGEDGTTDFYKVDRPTEGKWSGWTFVKLLTADGGFGDNLAEQRLDRAHSKSVLDKIEAAGPKAASQRYGHELGECGVCGRTLTNNDSIALGIGPVCAGKQGWV